MVRWSVSSVWVLILVVLIQLPSVAKDSTEYVLAPVFFVTDRIPFKVNGKIEKFTDRGQALTNTSAGVRYVPVPKRPDILETWSYLESLGWIDQSKLPGVLLDSKEHAEAAAAKLSDYDLQDSQVIGKIKNLPAFSGNPDKKSEVIFFIHGFFNDFADATNTAAELSSYFKRPIVAYAWMTPRHELQPKVMTIPKLHFKVPIPMPDIWQSYRESEVTREHSQERVNAFLAALDLSIGAPNMVLIAHSMGTRLLDQALVCRHGFYEKVPDEQKYAAVIMSNPDLDGRYFTSHALELSDEASIFRVFFVRTDEAMEASRFLHGAHYRLGAANESIFAQLRRTPMKMIDMTEIGSKYTGMMGHDMPCWVLANFHKYKTIDSKQENYWEEQPNKNDSLTIIHRQSKGTRKP
jgi:esterase/lipase superfamily enzyme